MSGSPVSPPPPTAITCTIRAGLAPPPPGSPPRSSGWPAPTGGRTAVALRRETVAARYRTIANQRRDFHHKTARTLVQTYDLIAVDDLAITTMVRRAKPVPDPANPGAFLPNGAAVKSRLNRSISDAGWGQFVSILRAKAEDTGRRIEIDRPPHLRPLRSLRARSQREPCHPSGIRLSEVWAPCPGRRARRTQHPAGRAGPSHSRRCVKRSWWRQPSEKSRCDSIRRPVPRKSGPATGAPIHCRPPTAMPSPRSPNRSQRERRSPDSASPPPRWPRPASPTRRDAAGMSGAPSTR